MTYQQLNLYVSHAISAWSSEGSFTITQSSSNSGIRFADITRSRATLLGIPASAAAATQSSKVHIGDAIYNGSRKGVYTISNQSVYLVYDSTSSQYGSNKWKAIVAHEFGHVVGYQGHDTASNASNKSLIHPTLNVVYDTWGVMYPQTRDLRHMGNI